MTVSSSAYFAAFKFEKIFNSFSSKASLFLEFKIHFFKDPASLSEGKSQNFQNINFFAPFVVFDFDFWQLNQFQQDLELDNWIKKLEKQVG